MVSKIIIPGQENKGLAVPAHLMQPQSQEEVMERVEKQVGKVKQIMADQGKTIGCTLCGCPNLVFVGVASPVIIAKASFGVYLVCDSCGKIEMFEVPAEQNEDKSETKGKQDGESTSESNADSKEG